MKSFLRNLATLLIAALMVMPVAWATSSVYTSTCDHGLIVSGGLTTDTLTVSGATTQTGNLAITGNETVGGTLGVTGAVTHSSTVTNTGAVTNSSTVTNTGAVTNSSTLTQTGVATFTAAPVLSTGTITANGDTNTIPDLGDASFVMTAGTQTIAGAKTFSTAPTITGGLTAANIQTGSAKRQVAMIALSPNTGAAADGTLYRGAICFGRAGTVKAITLSCELPPTVGTDVCKVLKNGSSGNTMLNAANYNANSLTANTGTAMSLTATGGDLALTATDTVYAEYSAGTQTQDAIGVRATIEFEPTDF
jgi:hypothetical protein